MKRVFLDTNFIIDYFVREDYAGDAEKVMMLGDSMNMEFCISYLTVANFAYIMRKSPADKLKTLISRICEVFTVVSNTKNQILLNLQEQVSDFEDGLQYQAAVYAGCDCMITRNKKDFQFAEIPVFTPEEFLIYFKG
ncbi:MAG: PIN domain-containing protein [Duncaniella sp.]|nr:PIN domain-containing protein [Duncaniella sp.]